MESVSWGEFFFFFLIFQKFIKSMVLKWNQLGFLPESVISCSLLLASVQNVEI